MRPLAQRPAQSAVERAKRDGKSLRGTLREALDDPCAGFDKADAELLKFHGAYQQADRDARKTNAAGRRDRHHIFMVRVKIPAGLLTAQQYLAMDQLAEEVVHDQSLRITTRQNFQLHGVLKGDLRSTIQIVNEALLSTLSGCGDVERNIVAPPYPFAGAAYQALRDLALRLTQAMTPRSRAYHEIWLDEAKVSGPEAEPLYGRQYLPRKFKTGLALPEDNSVEVYAQDLGLIGIVQHGRLARLNFAVGGGVGFTHRRADTYARLASPMGSVDAADTIALARLVAGMFRDYGDRTERKHARLKYVVEEYGIDAFAAELRARADFPVDPWIDIGPLATPHYLGRHDQGDGRYFYAVGVPNGRIVDDHRRPLKTALSVVAYRLRPRIVLTPTQDILYADLAANEVEELEAILGDHGIPRAEELSPLRRASLSCPALPTCGLALTEAERVSHILLDQLEVELERLGIGDAPVRVRLTGCPNGCARPYNSDLGIVGRKPGHYDLYVAGTPERLARYYAESVPFDRILEAFQPLLRQWADERFPEESLADYYRRVHGRAGRDDVLTGEKDRDRSHRVARAATDAGRGSVIDAAQPGPIEDPC